VRRIKEGTEVLFETANARASGRSVLIVLRKITFLRLGSFQQLRIFAGHCLARAARVCCMQCYSS